MATIQGEQEVQHEQQHVEVDHEQHWLHHQVTDISKDIFLFFFVEYTVIKVRC